MLAAAAALVFTGADSGGDGARKTYEIEFDSAFGLVEGGDLKIGGVKAGTDDRVRATSARSPTA